MYVCILCINVTQDIQWNCFLFRTPAERNAAEGTLERHFDTRYSKARNIIA